MDHQNNYDKVKNPVITNDFNLSAVPFEYQNGYAGLKVGNGLSFFYHPQFIRFNEAGFPTYSNAKESDNLRFGTFDFTPKTQTQTSLNVVSLNSEKAVVIRDGAICLLKFIQLITLDPTMSDIEYFIGTTNDNMTSFCKKIGFTSMKNFQRRIIISRADLIESTGIIKEYLNRAHLLAYKQIIRNASREV